MNSMITYRPPAGDIQILNQIFERRLTKTYTASLDDISAYDRAELIAKFGELLRHLSSLMKITDSEGVLSLDIVLARLMGIITEALEADRSTLFLYDRDTDELFSRIAQGDLVDEIRLGRSRGIAGTVYATGQSVIIPDAYADSRFNPEVDLRTGYETRSVLCAPVRNWDNKIIGVAEVLNKRSGGFDEEDLALLEALTSHASAALESSQLYESVEKALRDEAQLLGVTVALSSELHLDALLDKIMSITTDVLDADRSTLFLHDPESDELWSKVAEGLERHEIRIPAGAGIAGSVFRSGETINITDAYADPRFNPRIDRETGYKTRSILCMPVVTNEGRTIGVTQVLNKAGGPFGPRDEKRLEALAAQAAIALENARLFEDVLNARNYSESILKSLSNGVITLDASHRILKANQAALRILGVTANDLLNHSLEAVFEGENAWIIESLARVEASGDSHFTMDADLAVREGDSVSVNLNIERLTDVKDQPIGFMLVFEDITSEKRVKTTMARYMDPELADRIIEAGESLLGGMTQEATVLFSDIRSFMGMAEKLGARETVSVLNEYFSEMVDVVYQHHGILDKYIGDALMAVFGTPFPHPGDADHAVEAAIEMMLRLREFNRARAAQALRPIDIRLGISTGEVVAGNIGSPKRMDYTVIGDSVNLASRLESANKFYGTHVLLSAGTYAKLRRTYPVRELDLIQVKGRREPVAIYEVLIDGPGRPSPKGELRAVFANGLAAYRSRDWENAIGHFQRLVSLDEGDRAAHIFLERSQYYWGRPPPEDWDGVWAMTEK